MRFSWFLAIAAPIACAAPASAQDKTPAPKVLHADGGRYVFGQISDFRADQFMLDTKTGRLWQLVIRTNDKGETVATMLQVVPYTSPSDDKWTLEPR